MEASKRFKVFYQFQIADGLKQSGITFRTTQSTKLPNTCAAGLRPWGSAVAVADVDGDGLYDIYFVNEGGGNELWKNLGGGKFNNITPAAGVGMPNRVGVAAALAAIDNDGPGSLRHHPFGAEALFARTTTTHISKTSPWKAAWGPSLTLQERSF